MKRKKRQRTIGTTGDDARDGALAMLEDLASIYVNRGRRIMLQAMLRAGFATADDVYGSLGLPSDIDPRCLGAVPKALASAGIIRAAGFVKSNRPQRNASYIRRNVGSGNGPSLIRRTNERSDFSRVPVGAAERSEQRT